MREEQRTSLQHDLHTIGVGYIYKKHDFKSNLAESNKEAKACKHIHFSIIDRSRTFIEFLNLQAMYAYGPSEAFFEELKLPWIIHIKFHDICAGVRTPSLTTQESNWRFTLKESIILLD